MKTLIGLPTYDGNVHVCTALAAALQAGRVETEIAYSKDSMLTRCFNRLWLNARNRRSEGITHFAMIHADIIPEPGWLEKLHNIMRFMKADILSVVSPLKNADGLTSTALYDLSDRWKCSRFTMRQLQTMPPTFTHPRLLVNTGCMLIDLRGDWVDKVYFRTEDAIADGKVKSLTEDYLFSIDAAALDAKVFATRAVGIEHVGSMSYTNMGGWGLLETDHEPAVWEEK